jgi:hypothetical protein
LWPIGTRAADLLAVNGLRTSGLKRIKLTGEILILRRYNGCS